MGMDTGVKVEIEAGKGIGDRNRNGYRDWDRDGKRNEKE